MAHYYYRVFTQEGKLASISLLYERQVEHLHKHGRVNLGYTYVAKPCNILMVPTEFARKGQHQAIRNFIMSLPITVDLRTIHMEDYPELFI